MANFRQKVPFWAAYWHSMFFIQYCGNFFGQRSGEIDWNLNMFVTSNFFFHQVYYSHLSIWWLLRKLAFFGLFCSDLEKIGLLCYVIIHNIKNITEKYLQKIRKQSISRLFLRCCNGKMHISHRVTLIMNVFHYI